MYKTKKNTEILTPLSSGVFLKSNLKDNDEVIMSVGSSVTVKKSISEAKDLINKQHQEINTIIVQLEKEVEGYTHTIMSLEKELSQAQ